jgi:hypothetical protein
MFLCDETLIGISDLACREFDRDAKTRISERWRP